MNKKKMSKRQRDIKSKLMAAIAMLLVSSIMMVSTTYAWFTLSTAPEVTGITTAVGANGNLEIALQNPKGIDPAPSAEGDANKSLAERNLTWGNLVDVSDESVYGLNLISLYPAKLNYGTDTTEGKKTVGSKPLATPVYGADGRVANLEAKTLTGIFDAPRGQFSEMTDEKNQPVTQYGVRAVGVSSDLTARNMAYRTAIADAAAAKSQAVNTAKISMANEGSNLANIAVKHALGQDSAGYSKEEMGYLKKALTDLDSAMASLETSLRQSIIANSIAAASDDGYTEIITAINNCKTLSDLITAAASNTNIKIPAMDNGQTVDGENGIAAKLAASRNSVSSALSTVQGLIDANSFPVQWDSFASALNGILNTGTMKVNGMTITQIQGDGLVEGDGVDGKSELINAVLGNNSTALLTMESGSGAYTDIADFSGEYSGSFKMLVSYGSLTNVPVNAVMTATPTVAGTVYLDHLSVAAYVAGTGGTSAAGTPISEFYGYIIDLAFRTNAAGSKLKLQQEGIQRIYNGENASTNSATQGNGASMTFESADSSFGLAQVRNLMANLRLVFFDSDTNEIKTYGRLDMATAVDEGSKVTAYIYLTDAEGNAQTGEGEDGPYIIMDLTQNEVHELSVMVYLDGDSVENADVAATATKSMTGVMNLQFSSTAELMPMEYSELKTEGGGSENTVITINDVTAPTGFTASSTYVMNKTLYFGLAGTVAEGNKVYVSVDGGAYAEAAFDETLTNAAAAQGQTGVSIYKLAGMADTVTKDSEVLIAVAASAPATPAPGEGTGEDPDAGTQENTYDVTATGVTITSGVTENKATAGTDIVFTLADSNTSVTVTIGGNTVVPTESDGTYTIAGTSINGAVVITGSAA